MKVSLVKEVYSTEYQHKKKLEKMVDVVVCFGTNPCSEIILRPNQFCNLTEVV